MSFSRKTLGLLLPLALLLSPLPADAAPRHDKPQRQTTSALDAKKQLDAFALNHVQKANLTLKPGKNSVSVRKVKHQYEARYLELDPASIRTEIYECKAPNCEYVGHMLYLEKTYHSYGKNQAEAKKGVFKAVKARRIRELARYHQGQWKF